MNHLPVLVIVIPLIGGFLLSFTELAPLAVRRNLKRSIALLAAGTHAIVLLTAATQAMNHGTMWYYLGEWRAPVGIVLRVDRFAAFFLATLALGHVMGVLIRMGTQHVTQWEGKSAALLSLLFAAFSGIVVTADLFNLYVFIELATVTSVGLISRKQYPSSAVAGFMYLMVGTISGALLLFAILIIYSVGGTVTMPLIAPAIQHMPATMRAVVVAAITVSLGIKFGMVPFHFWQPRAYRAAGMTASGVLSGFGMNIYIYALIRVLWEPLSAATTVNTVFLVLTGIAIVTILTGHIMALWETNLVRMLAYSSVAHSGYILVAFAAAGKLFAAPGGAALATGAIGAAMFHMAVHSIMKSTLLWSGHHFVFRSGSSIMTSHHSLGRPGLGPAVAFSVAALAIIGIPPTAGFASKWAVAAAQIHLIPVLAIAAGTAISLGYYVRYFIILFATPSGVRKRRDATVSDGGATILLLLMAVVLVYAGLQEESVRSLLVLAAESLINPEALP